MDCVVSYHNCRVKSARRLDFISASRTAALDAAYECRVHGCLRRGAGRGAVQIEQLERRQPAAVERSGDGGAAGVGDLGAEEVELGSDLYF